MSPDAIRLRRALIGSGIACLVAAAILILAFDPAIERWLWPRVPLRASLISWQHYIDWATLKPISAAVGPVVLFGGWLAWRKAWLKTRFVMGWGALLTASQYSVDLIKWIAGRERPLAWLAEAKSASGWLDHGQYSFPSGHTAYYWALALGIAIRWPRLALPALTVAIYVAEQRVLVLAHHAGDVAASIGIALLWSGVLIAWLRDKAMEVRDADGDAVGDVIAADNATGRHRWPDDR